MTAIKKKKIKETYLSIIYSTFLVLILIFVLLSQNLMAQTIISADYYFDAALGDDANDGTSPQTAWKTATKFNATTFPPGTIIAFRDSLTYKGAFVINESGTNTQPITITNYYGNASGKLPFIIGQTTTQLTDWTQTSGYTNVWQTTIQSNFKSVWFLKADSTRWGYRVNSVLDLSTRAEQFRFYVEGTTLYVYSPSNPATQYDKVLYDYGDEFVTSAYCFQITGQYINLKNLAVGYVRGKGVVVEYGSDNTIIDSVTASYCGKSGNIYVMDEGGDGIQVKSSNVTVKNCTAFENAGHGFYVWGTSQGTISNIIFENNVGYNNHHTVGFDVNSSTGLVRNVYIRNNFIYTTAGSWWADYQYNGNLQGGNSGPMGNFFKGETSGLVKNVYFYNNIIKDNVGVAVQINATADSVYIYNNTIVKLDSTGALYNGAPQSWAVYGGAATTTHFVNNIVVAAYSAPNNYIVRAYNNTYSNNNIVYRLDGGTYLMYPNDPNYNPPINANPLLSNMYGFSKSNFQLQSNSPAINAGATATFFNTDIIGTTRPQGSAWDIGAFEYNNGQIIDNTPPEVVNATLLDSVTLNITFSEPLESSGAINPANYQINNGITVNNVELISNSVVKLNTTIHSPGFYIVTVNNVTDTAGNVISSQNKTANYGYNPDPLPGLLKFTPSGVLASSIPEPQHLPEKTFDGLGYNSGDPASRWAAQGLPQWIVYDLGDVRMVNKTRIQYFRWLEGRIYTYSILSSVDSINWTIIRQNIQSHNVEWNEENFEPIPARYIKILVTGNNESDWANIWETEIYGRLVVSGNEDDNLKPDNFSLEQNYPNPFNPVTKIRYSIPGDVETRRGVSLRVFDILGNEVATLVNEYKEPGRYEVEFNASGLTSGVYVYRLQTDGYINAKKMILMK